MSRIYEKNDTQFVARVRQNRLLPDNLRNVIAHKLRIHEGDLRQAAKRSSDGL